MLSAPLQQIVEADEGLFGVDETIAIGAVLYIWKYCSNYIWSFR